ncbi:MAG: type IV pilus secretin PilQ [Polyangiaceae bacterium]|nr:type IV pilus secretin PilQ [Polyangiaceae bacterium]
MRSRARAFPAYVLLLFVALVAPVGAAHAAGRDSAVTTVAVDAGRDATRVRLGVTAKPTYSARLERNGTRLVVDLADVAIDGAPPTITQRTGLVAGVLLQEFHQAKRTTTRVLVTLTEPAEFSIDGSKDSLVITLRAGGPRKSTDPASPVVVRGAAPPKPTTARIVDVRFQHEARLDTVVVEVGSNVRHRTLRSRPGRTRISLEGAALPQPLERILDVTAYGGPVQTVAAYPSDQRPDSVIIEVEHAGDARGVVSREGGNLLLTFATAGVSVWSDTGVGADGGPARRARTVSVEDTVDDLPEVRSGYAGTVPAVREDAPSPDDASGFGATVLGQPRTERYTGRRVDLDLKDADIHNVLRLLADVGRVNIITSDSVDGTVTIRMRNVPWDQALDVVLQSKKLGMIRQGNLIRVAPLADLEKERELELARRKQAIALEPLETRLIPVSYGDAADIQPRARELLSSRGSIAVDARTNVLIVRDIVGNLNQIEELTRALDTQTPQVLVEARIIEATSRYFRDLGIQWGGDISFSAATGNPTGIAFPHTLGIVGGASDGQTPTAGLSPFTNTISNPNFAVNLPAPAGTGQGGAIGLAMGSVDNTVNMNLRLTAAEATGMLRILSSPRILTLDNQQARIAQGTLIPFSQVSAQGVQTVFQEAKLQLLVKPHVTADGSVLLNVKVNRDEPDFNQTSARGDPTILKREAETTLLIADGHTAVIGGIYTRSTGKNVDQVPFFGDLPILGLLFQHRRATDQRGELVIFITPRIVNRAEALGE